MLFAILGYMLFTIIAFVVLASLVAKAPHGNEDEDGFRYV
jgi:hypothetical protein